MLHFSQAIVSELYSARAHEELGYILRQSSYRSFTPNIYRKFFPLPTSKLLLSYVC